MSKKTVAIWLGVILIIAGVMRFTNFASTPPGLYPDEAMDGSNAEQALDSGHFQIFYQANNGEEGLFALLVAVVIKVTGALQPWTVRLPSALFGFFNVLGVFFLARELFRKSKQRDAIALVATFFIAVLFWHVNFSRIGFRAIMSPFFLTWAMFFFLKSVHAESTKWRWIHGAIAGVFFGLGFYTYISYRIAPFMFLVMVPFFWKDKKFWTAALAFVAVTFLVALPIGLYFVHHPADFFGRSSEVSVFSAPGATQQIFINAGLTLGMLDIHGDSNWRHNISGRPELFWPIGIAFWIGVVLGGYAIFRRKKNIHEKEHATAREMRVTYWLLFAWVILASFAVIFSNESLPHALRGLLMVPGLMIFAGAGAVWTYEWFVKKFPDHRQVILGLALVALAVIGVEEAYAYFFVWAPNPNTAGSFLASELTVAEQLQSLPPSYPKYIITPETGFATPIQDAWVPGQTDTLNELLQPILFLTNTYTVDGQKADNMHYLTPAQFNATWKQIPQSPQPVILNINV